MPLSGHKVLVIEDTRRNVLVVDDDPVTNWCMKDLLEKSGARAQSCLNGESALTAIGVSNFDALVVDVYMPGIDGVSLVRKLRSIAAFKNLPVVIISAGNIEGITEDVQDLKFVAVISKPFEINTVIETLKQLWRMT